MESNNYWNEANKFKVKIQSIPGAIKSTNNKVDFSSGRYQEVMIDIEGYIETLENDFYLYSEEVEKLITAPDLTIDKCIEYLKENASKLNKEQVILFQSINVSCSCTACPGCASQNTGGFFCNKCVPI